MRTCMIAFAIVVAMPTLLSAATQPSPTNPQQIAAKDPKMALAERANNFIEGKERDLVQDEETAFRLIEEALRQIPVGTLQSQEHTLDGFRQATAILRKSAHDLLANRDKILTDIDVLRRMYGAAVPIYRDGAKTFIDFSKSEPYGELQDEYRRLAETWNVIADKMEKNGERFAEENKEMAETLRYLERIALFLDRLQQHFDSIPDLKSLKDREKYLANLRHFIKSFENFRELFREFDTGLRSNAIAADLHFQKNIAPVEVASGTDTSPQVAKETAEKTAITCFSTSVSRIQNAVLAQCESPAFRIAMPFAGLPLLIGCCVFPVKCCRWMFGRK